MLQEREKVLKSPENVLEESKGIIDENICSKEDQEEDYIIFRG